MGEPITKQRLKNYISLSRSVESRMERLTRMKNEALIPAMKESDGSSRTPGASRRMEAAIIRSNSYEEEMLAEVEEKMKEMETIRSAIGRLDDPQEQEVLRHRYIDCEGYRHTPWRDIAMLMFGDDDEARMQMVYRVHGRAVHSIENIET